MKILFLTDNFPPEINAPATRTYEHCIEWIKKGVQVTVITGFPNYPKGRVYNGYRNKPFQKENMEGITVIRVWTYIAPNSGLFLRIVDYVSFGLTSILVGVFVAADIIVATSPQFFTAISGCILSNIMSRKWVMEIRDIWPEQMVESGINKDSTVYKILEKIEIKLYKSANLLIVVTNSFKTNLISKGTDPNKVQVITNGANLELFNPEKYPSKLNKSQTFYGKVLFGYIGTIGLAHNIQLLIDAFAQVKSKNAHLIIMGEGALKQSVINIIKYNSYKNISVLDSVPKAHVPDFIYSLKYSIVNLRKANEYKTVIPSKIFELCSMARPILLGVEGESARIIKHFNCGYLYDPSSSSSLARLVDNLIENGNKNYKRMQDNCLKMALYYNRKNLAKKMLEHIKGLKNH